MEVITMMYVIAFFSDVVYFVKMFFEKLFGLNKEEEAE